MMKILELKSIQYLVFTYIIKRKKINISMTEENHCCENETVEIVNVILKDELYRNQTSERSTC